MTKLRDVVTITVEVAAHDAHGHPYGWIEGHLVRLDTSTTITPSPESKEH